MVNFLEGYKEILHFIAEVVVYSLELIGILIIVLGTIKALGLTIYRLKNKQPVNIVMELGKSLSLALEFKLGAEIINTVIIRDLQELLILAVVIIIRALLAVLIHWEIKMEKDDFARLHKKSDTKQDGEE